MAQRTDEDGPPAQGRAERDPERNDGPSGNGSRSKRRPVPDLQTIQLAKDGLTAMTGRFADSVSSIHRDDEGWRLSIEVVELERVPSTTNLMATYEVMVDDDGNLIGYEQVRRYMRGQADES